MPLLYEIKHVAHFSDTCFLPAKQRDTDTNPLYIAIETEDIEDTVGIHLEGIQSIHHDHWRVSVGTILARWRGRWPIAWPVASSPSPSHWWPHTPTFIGWGSVALIVAVVTTSWRMRRGVKQDNINLHFTTLSLVMKIFVPALQMQMCV